MISVPAKITVRDPPKITSVDLIQQVVDNIRDQIKLLDNEISTAQQGDVNEVKTLYDDIHEISSRAEMASELLAMIRKEPTKKEYATSKLDGSSDLLRQIKKLTDSMKELETELFAGEFDYYRIIADLLTDVQGQMTAFSPYAAVPHIILIKNKLTAIESELKRQVQWSFREIGQLVTTEVEDASKPAEEHSPDLTPLAQIYVVVDALGISFRNDLLERFAQLQLIPYEKLFKEGTRFSTLEHLDRRFAWFKRLNKAVDDKLSSIMSPSWCVQKHLFKEFTRRTKKHIAEHLVVLERSDPEPQAHVQSLLKALKSVVSFDAESKAAFAVADRGTSRDSLDVEDVEEAVVDSAPESIADAFDNFLGPYVQLEREELENLMDKLMRAEDARPDGNEGEGEAPARPKDPFISSRKMFEFIKQSLKRCTGFSRGITYLSLSKEFRICLHNYAESLKFKCPSPVTAKPGKPPVYIVSPQTEVVLCRIINTAEYCIDTIPALEAMMKNHISPSLTEEVDFSGQLDAFGDLVSFTMGILNQAIGERIDPALKHLRKTNWSAVEVVGDDSPYVKELTSTLSEAVVRMRACLSSSYFQNWCMKLGTVVLDCLLASIWRLKRIAKTGAGQLLLDLNGIKEYLLKMPNVRLKAGEDSVSISKAYNTFVTNRIHNIEVILKLVCTDDDKMTEMFALLWPEGQQSDLEAVMALKQSAFSVGPLDVVVGGVGDILKDGARGLGNTVVGRGAKGAVGDIKNAGKAAVGGIKSAFGDISHAMLSGNLFDLDSHGSEHGKSQHGSSSGSGGGGVGGGMKSALGGFNAAFGFSKGASGGSVASPAPNKPK